MYVCESDSFAQYGPVKNWVHCKSISHLSPPNWPVSATAGDETALNLPYAVIIEIRIKKQEDIIIASSKA